MTTRSSATKIQQGLTARFQWSVRFEAIWIPLTRYKSLSTCKKYSECDLSCFFPHGFDTIISLEIFVLYWFLCSAPSFLLKFFSVNGFFDAPRFFLLVSLFGTIFSLGMSFVYLFLWCTTFLWCTIERDKLRTSSQSNFQLDNKRSRQSHPTFCGVIGTGKTIGTADN